MGYNQERIEFLPPPLPSFPLQSLPFFHFLFGGYSAFGLPQEKALSHPDALTNKGIKEAFASTYAAPFRFLRPLFCGSDPCAPLRNCRLDFRPASRRTPDDTMMIVHSNAEQGFWMTIQSNEEDKYIIHIYPYRSIAPMEQEKLIIERNVLMRVINDCLSTQERHKAAPSMFPFL